jgi:hypothetical protein
MTTSSPAWSEREAAAGDDVGDGNITRQAGNLDTPDDLPVAEHADRLPYSQFKLGLGLQGHQTIGNADRFDHGLRAEG